MAFTITNPNQIIKIDVVRAGCREIQEGLDDIPKTGQDMSKAIELLGHNSLVFGDRNSTLEKELGYLNDDLVTFTNNYSTLADDILAQAEKQYEDEWNEYYRYLNWLESQRKKTDQIMGISSSDIYITKY